MSAAPITVVGERGSGRSANPNTGGLRVVRFDTDDGLRLSGLLNDVGSDTTVIHVHGFGGNFYENTFVDVMRDAYAIANLNFLAFNNRGHGSYVEAYQNGAMAYVGAAVEDFEDCLLDIGAAVRFAQTVGSRVVLQGHCMGAHKIMHYARRVDSSVELILLAPCDMYRAQAEYIHPERVEDQIARLRASYRLEGMEWLPAQEYGVKVPGVEYHVPVVAGALVAMLSSPAYQTLRADAPWQGETWPNRAFVYLGGRDPLNFDGIAPMKKMLGERLSDASVVVFADGGHQLKPVEREVSAAIAEWVCAPQRCQRRDDDRIVTALAA